MEKTFAVEKTILPISSGKIKILIKSSSLKLGLYKLEQVP